MFSVTGGTFFHYGKKSERWVAGIGSEKCIKLIFIREWNRYRYHYRYLLVTASNQLPLPLPLPLPTIFNPTVTAVTGNYRYYRLQNTATDTVTLKIMLPLPLPFFWPVSFPDFYWKFLLRLDCSNEEFNEWVFQWIVVCSSIN